PKVRAFNRQFPENATWHFVNLPLGTRTYEEARAFTSPSDVVHAIHRCIAVLESPEPIPGEFNRLEALCLLVHFVGDVHQPLHCGSGYYRLEDPHRPELVKAPARAIGLPSDRGGNGLFYAPGQSLHLLWDVGLVEEVAGFSKDYRLLLAAMTKASQDVPVTPGDYHDWAELWAAESVRIADSAYKGIQFGDAVLTEDRESVEVIVTLPADYADANAALVLRQLVRAAVRLAQLLDRIAWPQGIPAAALRSPSSGKLAGLSNFTRWTTDPKRRATFLEEFCRSERTPALAGNEPFPACLEDSRP
ncbi:MAG: S1/P1 nuclease, partial [Verrucomicrobia bacterium]|nr:S1/P1 nuclease [Verrucomicrobiota bacterium]